MIASSTGGSGRGGTIDVNARSVILDGALLESVARGEPEGRGGEIRIHAADIILTGGALIRANTQSEADAGLVSISGNRLQLDRSFITSSSRGDGDGGLIDIRVDDILVANNSAITTESFGTFVLELDDFRGGAAGDIDIVARVLRLAGGEFGGSDIATSTATEGAGGDLTIRADQVFVEGGSSIESTTIRSGDAGVVALAVGDLTLTGGSGITTSSVTCAVSECDRAFTPTGDAGSVQIAAQHAVTLREGSGILSTSGGSGDAGLISIATPTLRLLDSGISKNTLAGSTGASGAIAIAAGTIEIIGSAGLETVSFTANEAGGILIEAGQLLVAGPAARISSSNLFVAGDGGDAGGIFISAGGIRLLDGAQLVTNSVKGAAGSIEIFMPETAILLLDSTGELSQITTSSGPGTGGRIFISNPLAIISNGGRILALGQQGGANVDISTQFFISSADRRNLVLVDGAFLLEAQVGDVSSGTVERDLSVVDASGVLRGQCAAVRATGQASQLIVRPTGPYGTRPEGGAAPSDSCF